MVGVVQVKICGAKNVSDDIAVAVTNLSKCYHLYERQLERIKQALWGRGHHNEFWALKDVAFTVKKGESVGIIGRNGSGKSTLLQIIAGTLAPTEGEVTVNGRVAALLALGSGFNQAYTGRENVVLNGMLLGLSKEEVFKHFDGIASFADIGNFLDQPVKTYSSGMMVRLAFAVQVVLKPDIFIIDEALAVGDYFFQQKCFGRLRQMQEDGLTMLLASHDMNSVANMCSTAVYLRKGGVQFVGDRRLAIRKYQSETSIEEGVGVTAGHTSAPHALPSRHVSKIPEQVTWRRSMEEIPRSGGLLAVVLLDMHGNLTTAVRLGEAFRLRVYFIPDASKNAHVYVNVKNKFDQIVFTTGTYCLDLSLSDLVEGEVAVVEFGLEANLAAGGYSFGVSLGEPVPPNQLGRIIDQVGGIGPLVINFDYNRDKAPFLGPFGLPVKGRIVT